MINIDWQSNGAKRVYTSAAIVTFLAAAFLLRMLAVWIFDIIVMLMAVVAVWEIMKVRRSDAKGVSYYYMFAYMFVAYMAFLLLLASPLWLHLVMQFIVFSVFGLYIYLMNYMDKDFMKEASLKKQKVSKLAWLSVYEFIKLIGYPFAMLFMLIPLNRMGEIWAVTQADEPVLMVGTFALLLVFVISCFTDTFAYLTGKAVKGPKLLPKKVNHISPNKTISGAVGGLFGGVLGSLLLVLLCSMDGTFSQYLTEQIGDTVAVQLVFALVGLVGAVVTMAGDLYASWIKRRAEVKDFGKFLPGHGGIMDRLDGISFNSLFIFIIFMIIVFI